MPRQATLPELGDFVRYNTEYGIVTGFDGNSTLVTDFRQGYPVWIEDVNTDYCDLQKTDRDSVANYIRSVSRRFHEKIKDGGRLPRAISSRKLFHLNGILSNLESGKDPLESLKVDRPATDTHVLMGVYSGQGPSEHLDVLVVPNRTLSEYDISRAMIGVKPKGYGAIPGDVYNTPATSHGSLVAYWTYAVPEDVINFVEHRRDLFRLDDIGSRWSFSESMPK